MAVGIVSDVHISACNERFTVMTCFYGPEAMKSLERRVENVAYETNDDMKEVSDGLLRDKTVTAVEGSTRQKLAPENQLATRTCKAQDPAGVASLRSILYH
jgi:hypothetical protein